jgi:hypothetical protein
VGHQEPSSACYPYCLLSEVDSIVTSKKWGNLFKCTFFVIFVKLFGLDLFIYLFNFYVVVWRRLWGVVYACVLERCILCCLFSGVVLFYWGSGGSGWWFSIHLLVRIICIRNLIALWCMFFIVLLVY